MDDAIKQFIDIARNNHHHSRKIDEDEVKEVVKNLSKKKAKDRGGWNNELIIAGDGEKSR